MIDTRLITDREYDALTFSGCECRQCTSDRSLYEKQAVADRDALRSDLSRVTAERDDLSRANYDYCTENALLKEERDAAYENAARLMDEKAAEWIETALGYKNSGHLEPATSCLAYNQCCLDAAQAIRRAAQALAKKEA